MADLAVEVLKEIRDELRTTRKELSERIDATNSRLDTTNSRLDTTNSRLDRLERRQNEMETRLATELVAVVGAVKDLRDVILQDRKLGQAVADHETRLQRLERRAG